MPLWFHESYFIFRFYLFCWTLPKFIFQFHVIFAFYDPRNLLVFFMSVPAIVFQFQCFGKRNASKTLLSSYMCNWQLTFGMPDITTWLYIWLVHCLPLLSVSLCYPSLFFPWLPFVLSSIPIHKIEYTHNVIHIIIHTCMCVCACMCVCVNSYIK